jgi:hypothetical protein
LPASSWQRGNFKAPRIPATTGKVAADSGGFVATFKWGDYRYTPDEYVAWLHKFKHLDWSATMDYCCEREIASNEGIVRERQQRTSEMVHHFWKNYRDTSWSWTPTIQGWEVEDYRRHAKELKPLIFEMQRHYGDSAFRVGVGTLCARASATMVQSVVFAVSEILEGIPLHLWGVKLSVLKSRVALPNVVSVDSAAWDTNGFYNGRELRQERAILGMSQLEHSYKIMLPAYLAKVENALASPKQLSLFAA